MRTITTLLAGTVLAAGLSGHSPAHATTTPDEPVPTVEVDLASPAGAEASSPQGAGFLVHRSSGNTAWSTTGTKPSLTKVGPGAWKVRFNGITGTFGVPTVTVAPGAVAGICALNPVALVNNAVEVGVHCHKADGSPADAAGFAVSYTSIPGAQEAWFTTHKPTNTQPYTPQPSYSWVGGTVTTKSPSTGYHMTNFAALKAMPKYHTLTSAIDANAATCGSSYESTGPAGLDINIACYTPAKTPTPAIAAVHVITANPFSGQNGDWALAQITPDSQQQYHALGAVTNVGPLTVTKVSVGVTKVVVKNGASAGPALVHVAARGAGQRCNGIVAKSGADAVVTAKCWDHTGTPMEATYTLVFFGAA